MNANSIYEIIKNSLIDGKLPEDFSLPKLHSEDEMVFVDGGLDGIYTYHMHLPEMSKEDYYTIGNFEDFAYRYKRVKTSAWLYGRKVKGEIYILKQQLTLGLPNANYLNALRGAYIEAGLNQKVIDEALARVKEGNK